MIHPTPLTGRLHRIAQRIPELGATLDPVLAAHLTQDLLSASDDVLEMELPTETPMRRAEDRHRFPWPLAVLLLIGMGVWIWRVM